jgi:hypothetical protein
VGKKPPQSQKGGSHGLTPWTSAGLSPKEPKKKNIFYFFYFFSVAGDLAERRWAASAQQAAKIK